MSHCIIHIFQSCNITVNNAYTLFFIYTSYTVSHSETVSDFG